MSWGPSTNYSFGDWPIAAGPTPTVTFTLSNAGDASATVLALTKNYMRDAFLSDSSAPDACRAGLVVTPGGSCTVRVSFDPSQTGADMTTFVSHFGAGSTAAFTTQGNGTNVAPPTPTPTPTPTPAVPDPASMVPTPMPDPIVPPVVLLPAPAIPVAPPKATFAVAKKQVSATLAKVRYSVSGAPLTATATATLRFGGKVVGSGSLPTGKGLTNARVAISPTVRKALKKRSRVRLQLELTVLDAGAPVASKTFVVALRRTR